MNVVIRCGLRTFAPGIQRDFWVQTDESGTPLGWMMENGGRIWATLASCAPPHAAREMADFLCAKGFDVLEADQQVAQATGLTVSPLSVLCCRQSAAAPMPKGLTIAETSLTQLTDIVCKSGLLELSDRASFYANRHLHWRRGTDRFFAATYEGTAVCSGALSYGGGLEESITCIATLPQHRGKGYATALVRFLAAQSLAAGHQPVLACRKELVPFYVEAGFFQQYSCGVVHK